jgi:hypothetical protein
LGGDGVDGGVSLEDSTCQDTSHCRVCQVSPGPGDVAVLEGPGTCLRDCSCVDAGELCDDLIDPGACYRAEVDGRRVDGRNWRDVRWLVRRSE